MGGNDINRRRLLQASAGVAAIATGGCATTGRSEETVKFGKSAKSHLLAPTPPMGWNSWNSFATTITEEQALETARIMQEKLLPFGYDVFTIDIQWYEPEAQSYRYNENPVPAMDEYGRLLPAPNRFPSSVDGKGFIPIANQIHAMGMKFGVHLMRGIPREAVKRNTPVMGTNVRAQDIADTNSTCPWNPDMYGVDMTKPGAQTYYDSVFALFASWGVDYVKMDDMARPYGPQALEIEAAHKAIVNSGRPMTLSLSPGETPLRYGEHVSRYAQLWRISDDFWDEWRLLKDQFARLDNWTPWRRPGAWPDADMLPLGRLSLGERDSRFTPDEQQTVMSLWGIARSPLIMGGDLRHLDDATHALLTNKAIIELNQHSRDNRTIPSAEGSQVWVARPLEGDDVYLGLFNTSDDPMEVGVEMAELGLPVLQKVKVADLWTGEERSASGTVSERLRPHASSVLRISKS